MSNDKQQKPKPNVDKKEIKEFVARQPEQTQQALKKVLHEQGLLDLEHGEKGKGA
jgi:hypothetical protein